MGFTKEYERKNTSVETALRNIRSNIKVVTGLGAMESRGLMENLHTIKDQVKNVDVYTCLNMARYAWYTDKEMAKSFVNNSWFFNVAQREIVAEGRNTVSFVPNNLHMAGTNLISEGPVDIFWGVASPMDKNGFLSLSISATYERDIFDHADMVVLEVNENAPRTFGDTVVHISDVDQVYEYTYDLPQLFPTKGTPIDETIAEHVSELIPDGATLQIGIGGIPNAMTGFLMEKKDLGIHTEMLTEGMMDLFSHGVITNRRKNFHRGNTVCTFALGTKSMYDFIHDNPGIEFRKGSWVNSPYVIAKNDNMVSLNTALAIDLAGNVCSESLGTQHYSGTGGQLDTHRGAVMSKEGKGIIALRSTVKNDTISTIVPTHKVGSAYTIPRQDIDHIVTEYGTVKLRGKSLRERTRALIGIAHPRFREGLEEQARELRLM
ncbi:MAG: acetyl-CoA hydrolase/transferase C-terminal domain-containing protein [Candidatus Undinarchaeales archaeon]|jgi:acyl-CoA hydrolase|nr:acetyl-CoA hydrolase/transferase C-terminal domain-containing protein [Candidatus Undinarchaeales archaeon]MDP7491472.1 acetyl-CoA hydrolase/transferase C-terminal domain-containing protein [Candidatus Undinarchaeales archaeon]